MSRCNIPPTRVFRYGDLRFAVDAVPAFGYLFHHCHVPIISSVHVTNEGDSPLEPCTFSVDIPGYAFPCAVTIEPPPPGDTLRVVPVSLQLCYDRLQGLEGRRYAALTVTINGHEVFRDEILVLGFYEWSFAPEARKALACYVQPGHAVVQQILADAADSHEVGEDGVVRASPEGAGGDVEAALRRVYEALRCRYNLRYVLEAPSYETDGQAVRPPHRVIPNPRARAGAGTCIDLCLLFASCIEGLHLQPLVIVIREPGQESYHALVACWRNAGERYEPVMESKERLEHEVRRRKLLLFEATGVTCFAGHKLSFDEASAAADRRLLRGDLVFALDVAAARHTVTPLEFPLSPVVLAILAESQRIASRDRCAALETNHLLRATLCQATPGIGAFLASQGIAPGATPSGTDTPSANAFTRLPTLNYRRCLDDARSIAGDCGAGFVEDEHLLCALLLSSSHAVDGEFAAYGRSRAGLLQAFRSRFLWTRDLVSTEHGSQCEDDAFLRLGPPPAADERTKHGRPT